MDKTAFYRGLAEAGGTVASFWAEKVVPRIEALPGIVRLLMWAVIIAAAVNVSAAFIISAVGSRKIWKPSSVEGLMQGYFSGTGQYRRKTIYKQTGVRFRDKKWSYVSFAGLAYRLGNLKTQSKILAFLVSGVYLPLMILGAAEMVCRFIIGTVFTVTVGLAHWLILLLLGLIALPLRPILRAIDGHLRNKQHCTQCYFTFELPVFRCPKCYQVHKNLVPGATGLLFARCTCGQRLPVSVLSGRNRLSAFCPRCDNNQAAANTRQFTVQVIGGNSSGKTAFLASFSHDYISEGGRLFGDGFRVFPPALFGELEEYFRGGYTQPSSQTKTSAYTYLHGRQGHEKDSLVMYEIPDEMLLSGVSERNPLNFGYSDGIIFIIDPLSIPAVKAHCEEVMPTVNFSAGKTDDPEMIIVEFINTFSGILGRSSHKMINIPVAVVINKTDIKPIYREIGQPKMKAIFNASPGTYRNDFRKAQNDICREYLLKYGLSNAVNNLESVFSNVRYFSVSSKGKAEPGAMAFHPYGVLQPVRWLTEKRRSKLADRLKAASLSENASVQ